MKVQGKNQEDVIIEAELSLSDQKSLQALLCEMKRQNLSFTQVLNLLSRATVYQNFCNKIDLVFDYNQSIVDLILENNFDIVDLRASEIYMPQESGFSRQIFLAKTFFYHFDKKMTSQEVLNIMQEDGREPANSLELLSLSKKFPSLQKEFPIVALGHAFLDSLERLSVCNLFARNYKRELRVVNFNSLWPENYRFMALDKKVKRAYKQKSFS